MNGSELKLKTLSVRIDGASHAKELKVKIEGLPKFAVAEAELQAFMERRAPGRDETSTARREPDKVLFVADKSVRVPGLETNPIHAKIVNQDFRSKDYANVKSVPRPGHSDYPVWVKTGIIPAGGGAHSGRMTAMMCVAGGIAKQILAREYGVTVTAVTTRTKEEVLAAKAELDSIGGEITCTVTGMKRGLGWAMFDGIECNLSKAIFGIPGVKALSFGEGARAADMKGSEFNLPKMSGGLTGGMTNGEDVVLHVTMRPTPSIYKEQDSIDLSTGLPTKLSIKGRHDPCITLRALPVVEAMTALVMLDEILFAERSTPRICLTLMGKTIEEDLALIKANKDHIDMVELRVDHLEGEDELRQVLTFPEAAARAASVGKLPVILTLRREMDGGKLPNDDEDNRAAAFAYILNEGKGFKFVDFEDDFRREDLTALAAKHGARVIRSYHKFDGPVENLRQKLRDLKRNTNEIAKVAFMPKSPDDVTDAFEAMKGFDEVEHIVCAMGRLGQATRILAGRLGSYLTFCSAAGGALGDRALPLGHLSPKDLVTTYRFRSLTKDTQLFTVTGWPLEVTSSPELNNYAFNNEQQNCVMVPFPAETAEQFFRFAEVLNVRGSAVTIPHKEAVMQKCVSIDPAAKAMGAVNTLVRKDDGWHGYNTDAPGFKAALCEFLGVDTLEDKKVLMLGAGGAAKAVAYALNELKADVYIHNRTLEKAEALASKYWFRVLKDIKDFKGEIIVNASSVGLNSDADAAEGYEFTGKESVFDLVYHPEETTIMRRCREAGGKAENGFKMLINQAIKQRELYDYE